MTKLTLVQSKSLEEEIEEVQLPLFDIVESQGNWFTEQIKKQEEMLKNMEQEDDSNSEQ